MRATILAILGGMLASQAVAGNLYQGAPGPFAEIARGEQAQAQIVIPAQPTYLEEFAAAELQAYLAKASGAKLAIAKENGGGDSLFSFFLGSTRKAADARVAPEEGRIGLDGFALRSVPEGLVVLGRNDRGTLFGVYELLERYFGVRWFMPGEIGEQVPKQDVLRLGQIDLLFKPSFRVRRMGDGDWSLRQRMNAQVRAGGRDVGVNWKWHFHTFRLLIPPEKYYAEHPEYFALVKGKRTVSNNPTHENQLCTSNPDVVQELARNLIVTLDTEPGIEIIALSPNDGGGFCECDRCRALDEPGRDWFARYSRRLALFNNQVAKLVHEKHPQVLIKVGAYAMYARPPLDPDYRPAPNEIVQLCHLYFCHNHGVGSDACRSGRTYTPSPEFQPNQEFNRILNQWGKLTPHLYVYEYYTIGGLSKANLPWPVVHSLRQDLSYYRDRGVEGFYTQFNERSFYQLGLNYYVAAKLCWNADLDVDALLADYFEKFYGPAAAPMRDYFMAMEDSMQRWNGCVSYGLQGVSGLKSIGPKIFTPEVLARMGSSLQRAEGLAAGNDTVAKRVGLARQMYVETEQALKTIGGNAAATGK